MAIETINPATGELVKTYDEYSADIVENKLRQADKTFREWRTKSFDEKATLMKRAAEYQRKNKRALGEVITLEMGKPITQSIAEIEKCAWVCDWYAENAEQILSGRKIETDAERSYVRYDPVGPVLAVMPWNFPFWQVMRFAAPALMAGNVGVLKHASNVPLSALEIEKVFLEADFPEGCFSTLLISARSTESVIRDDRIVAVTLTGSEIAGSKVAATAGDALKKTVMELGGSDPYIVLADADLDSAATTGAQARNINAGQSCVAAKRFIVVEDVAEEFTGKFASALKKMKVCDPMSEESEVGPMARGDLRDELHDQVERSIKSGAHCALGGKIPEGPGYFYPVTLITDITEDVAVFKEETFGPVAALITVRDEIEAVRVANTSDYGLSSSLWTKDIELAETLAPRIDAGAVFINGMTKSDPRLPFGGVKRSGYGRELSEEGIREFCNAKTVWIGK